MYVFPVFVSTFYVVILIHKMYKTLYIKYQLFSDQYNNASNMIRYNLDPIYATVSYENYKYIPVLMWKWKRKIHSTQKLYVKLIGVLIKDFFSNCSSDNNQAFNYKLFGSMACSKFQMGTNKIIFTIFTGEFKFWC